MKLNNSIRYIFLTLYGIIAFLFLCSAIGLLLNHYLLFSPNKISNELGATLLYSFISIVISSIFAILFYLLWKEKKEVIILFSTIYLVCFIIFIASVFSVDWNDYKEVIFIVSIILFPSLNLIYLIKFYKKLRLWCLVKYMPNKQLNPTASFLVAFTVFRVRCCPKVCRSSLLHYEN